MANSENASNGDKRDRYFDEARTKPSRTYWNCRLESPNGEVFDVEVVRDLDVNGTKLRRTIRRVDTGEQFYVTKGRYVRNDVGTEYLFRLPNEQA